MEKGNLTQGYKIKHEVEELVKSGIPNLHIGIIHLSSHKITISVEIQTIVAQFGAIPLIQTNAGNTAIPFPLIGTKIQSFYPKDHFQNRNAKQNVIQMQTAKVLILNLAFIVLYIGIVLILQMVKHPVLYINKIRLIAQCLMINHQNGYRKN